MRKALSKIFRVGLVNICSIFERVYFKKSQNGGVFQIFSLLLKRDFIRCLRLKNEKISKSIADMQMILFLGQSIRLRLRFSLSDLSPDKNSFWNLKLKLKSSFIFWLLFSKKRQNFQLFFQIRQKES